MKKPQRINYLQMLASGLYIMTLLFILLYLWQSWHYWKVHLSNLFDKHLRKYPFIPKEKIEKDKIIDNKQEVSRYPIADSTYKKLDASEWDLERRIKIKN